jgi:hypothetical protein
MKIIGDFLLACLLCIAATGLVALQFACTIDNALEKYKKENEEKN